MAFIGRSLLLPLSLSVCLAGVAQAASPDLANKTDLANKIERQVRAHYKISPQIHVLVGAPSSSSEFPGYEAVVVTLDGGGDKQDITFLLSKDHSSMKRLTSFDLTKDPFAETLSKIDLQGRPTRGAKASKVVVVNFDDFECPYCSSLHQILFPEILKEYGDRVTFVYKDYPLLQIHPWAMHAAVDANCLAAQNADAYWDFADYIHANQHEVNQEKTPAARLEVVDRLTQLQGQKHNLDGVKLEACIKAQDERAVQASLRQGSAVGVEATPAMFINGEEIPGGAVPANVVRAALDRALKDNNLPVPEHAAAPEASAAK